MLCHDLNEYTVACNEWNSVSCNTTRRRVAPERLVLHYVALTSMVISTCVHRAKSLMCESRSRRSRPALWTRISSSTTRPWFGWRSPIVARWSDVTSFHLAITSSCRLPSNLTKAATSYCVSSANSKHRQSTYWSWRRAMLSSQFNSLIYSYLINQSIFV